MTKKVDERIDEGVLQWFGYVERMENDRIAKSVYEEEYTGRRSVVGCGRDGYGKDCSRKRGL